MAITILSSIVLLVGCELKSAQISAEETQTPQGRTRKISITINIDPPGSDVAAIDTTQALLTLSASNATLESTTGTATLSIKDLTNGQIVGQNSFAYIVRNESLFAQDPTAVHIWLQQFAGYADIDVIINVDTTFMGEPGTSSLVTGSAMYQGRTYAATSVSWENSKTVNCVPGRICPIQPPPDN
jgi:hypothetical protein